MERSDHSPTGFVYVSYKHDRKHFESMRYEKQPGVLWVWTVSLKDLMYQTWQWGKIHEFICIQMLEMLPITWKRVWNCLDVRGIIRNWYQSYQSHHQKSQVVEAHLNQARECFKMSAWCSRTPWLMKSMYLYQVDRVGGHTFSVHGVLSNFWRHITDHAQIMAVTIILLVTFKGYSERPSWLLTLVYLHLFCPFFDLVALYSQVWIQVLLKLWQLACFPSTREENTQLDVASMQHDHLMPVIDRNEFTCYSWQRYIVLEKKWNFCRIPVLS